MKELTTKEKELIKKIERGVQKKDFQKKKEMYQQQMDRNYKDGDRN